MIQNVPLAYLASPFYPVGDPKYYKDKTQEAQPKELEKFRIAHGWFSQRLRLIRSSLKSVSPLVRFPDLYQSIVCLMDACKIACVMSNMACTPFVDDSLAGICHKPAGESLVKPML